MIARFEFRDKRTGQLMDQAWRDRDELIKALKAEGWKPAEIAWLLSRIAKLYLVTDEGVRWVLKKIKNEKL